MALSNVLEPLLAYLSRTLPPPLYSILIDVLSHFLALASAIYTLTSALITTDPSHWNLQTILPPFIAAFTAYLAIISIYRTTSWMIRTSIWFIKWGTLLAVLMAFLGWCIGNARNADVGNYGATSQIGNILLELLNVRPIQKNRNTRVQGSQQSLKARPRASDSFQAHANWRNRHQAGDKNTNTQEVIGNIVSSFSKAMYGDGWLGFLTWLSDDPAGDDVSSRSAEHITQPSGGQKARSKAGHSRSR